MATDEDSKLLERYLLLMDAVRHPGLSKIDCGVLGQVLLHANRREDFAAWPSIQKMAGNLKASSRSVMRSVQSLELLGYIEVDRTDGSKSVYYPNLDAPTSDTDVTGPRVAPSAPVTPMSTTSDIPVIESPKTGDTHVTQNSLIKSNSLKNTGASRIDVEPKSEERSPEEQIRFREHVRSQYLLAIQLGAAVVIKQIRENYSEHITDLMTNSTLQEQRDEAA